MMSQTRVPEPRIVHDPDAQRYEIYLGDVSVGFAAYRTEPDRVVFTHTRIDSAYEGRGLGSRLIAAALAEVRAGGSPVEPQCPFVAAYIRRHPESAEVVANAGR
jgi:predicted GNAT family acetyltransferase